MRTYNRTRYCYNPYENTPMLSSVHCLIVAKPLLDYMVELLDWFFRNMQSCPQDKMQDSWEVVNQALDHCIRHLKLIPRSYYEHWMLYQILRGIVYLYFGFDVEGAREYATAID